jgi:hypothetical protein
VRKLNADQRSLRRPDHHQAPYIINKRIADIPSYFHENHAAFIHSLVEKYNVDEGILDYNLHRLFECFKIHRTKYIHHHQYAAEQFELNEKQKKYALEFYLQIDGRQFYYKKMIHSTIYLADLFFMKTCSFRNAKPRSTKEGLFCIDEPDIRYSVSACNNCSLCRPSNDITRQHKTTLRVDSKQPYRFVNGYQTILNCPANCQTRNMIYVMVCPCGEYEYVGETSQRIADRLRYHRQHTNRIIHEFLIGEENVRLVRNTEKDYEYVRMNTK